MKVVVTGATGNVGTSTVKALSESQEIDEIAGLARREPTWAPPKTSWVEANVLSADLGAKIRYPSWQIWADGEGGIDGILEGQVHAVLSNIGLAGCGSIRIKVPVVSQISSLFGGKDVYVNLSGGASLDFNIDFARPGWPAGR